MDIFSSHGASLLVLLVQGLFAWALWSLRRAFVRTEDYALHLQRDARRRSATARRLGTLEEHLRLTPDTADMAGLHSDLAALRGEMQALNARIPLAWTGCLNASNTALTDTRTGCAMCRKPLPPLPAVQARKQQEAIALMPPQRTRTDQAQRALAGQPSEQRLDLLTRTLSAADIAEKSIDIVKEIKELHAILRSLRDDTPETPPRMVVVWGGPPSAASGRLPRSSGKAASPVSSPGPQAIGQGT